MPNKVMTKPYIQWCNRKPLMVGLGVGLKHKNILVIITVAKTIIKNALDGSIIKLLICWLDIGTALI
jgi:hypothetical protein